MFVIIFVLTIEQLCSLITLFKFVHSFAVVARLRRERTSDFTFFGGRKHKKTTSSFFFGIWKQCLRIQLQKKLPTFAELNEME